MNIGSKRIDAHVHIVGNARGGNGCWIRSSPLRWPLQALMLRHIGLPAAALEGDLDVPYIAQLLRFVRESSLDAAVILAQEQVYDSNGRLMEGYGTAYVPNEYVLRLARENPEFLPAVSIHPARLDALEELERGLSGGAVMMKCLPNCQNIDCSDRRFTKFWERMAEAKLPLLAHTGGEHTLQVVRAEFADPACLEWPLQCGVTVIAAHAANKSGLFDPNYFPKLAALMERYPNLYADNSAFNANFRGSVTPECLRPPVAERMVHGSDFPVPVFGVFPWLQGQVSWQDYCRSRRDPNVMERDAALKRAMGFGDETFTRLHRLLRPTAAVLAPARTKTPRCRLP